MILNFAETFYVECDASGLRLGAVLSQGCHPIAFFSKVLKGKTLHLSTYEKELLALVVALPFGQEVRGQDGPP